jgi:3-oxoacyl-[acyl-carrier protein] reductase
MRGRRFAAEGAKVIVADIDEAGAGAVAESIPGSIHIKTDVSSGDDVATMIARCEEAFGGMDILVNNAGWTHRRKPILDVSEEDFDKVYATNVKSIYLGAIHGVPALIRRGGGVILNIASTAGGRPRPGLTWYNGTKGAVITLTKSMAVELAEHGIRVCAINPVIGDTGLTAEFMGGEDTPEIRARFIATIPLGRMSTPADVASAALFLCSDDAEFITGVAIDIDGGRSV